MRRRAFLRSTALGALVAAFRLRSRRLFAAGKPLMSNDPILSPWGGPHGGFPRFDKIAVADIKPALEKAMELKRTEIAKLVAGGASAQTPTFATTIAALEDAGRP